jgi:hypothetical protein
VFDAQQEVYRAQPKPVKNLALEIFKTEVGQCSLVVAWLT